MHHAAVVAEEGLAGPQQGHAPSAATHLLTIGALGMIGIPPVAGFISKWYLGLGAVEAGMAAWILPVLVASSLLNAAYFMPIVYAAFFLDEDPGHRHVEHGEAPLPIVLALVATALFTILLFFFPGVPLTLVQQMAGGG